MTERAERLIKMLAEVSENESVINLIYDPIYGAVYPDGEIDRFCDVVEEMGRFRSNNLDEHTNIHVGSLLMVDELRARMVEGRLKINKMIYRYTDKETNETKDIDLNIDSDARIEFWPEGFCDYNEKSLLRILGW
jgi:hypothetical protein